MNMALDSPQTTNHSLVQKMTEFNFNGSACPLARIWRDRQTDKERLKCLRPQEESGYNVLHEKK